jgi:hypothetical protein
MNITMSNIAIAAVALSFVLGGCDAQVNTSAPGTTRETTVVTPAGGGSKTENNTTIVQPAKPAKTETNTSTTVTPGGTQQSTTTETK